MSVPKQRQTSGRSRRRRAQHSLKSIATSTCSECQRPILSHRACEFCGYYGGKKVLDIKVLTKSKKDKKEAK